MEEYEKKYMSAKEQFLKLMDKNCNGRYPINGASLSDDVIYEVIFDASLRKNNFDLLVFIFFNFSQYESFSNFTDYFRPIFAPQIPYDDCYFLYCLLMHINAIFERESDVITVKNLCSSCGEKRTIQKMLPRDRISFQHILGFDNKFGPIFSRALLYINCLDEENKRQFIEQFPALIYPKGSDVLLFLKLLGASNFHGLCSELNNICGISLLSEEFIR